jgi:peptidoglycan/LPS O-acetylase OafA/YrhL
MKPNYRALTSLRFVAAIAVVFYHYALAIRGIDSLPKPFRNLIHCGPLALSFFFVLSGFVLSSSNQHRSGMDRKARRAFWFARFTRLYPSYLIAFFLFTPMALQKYLLHPTSEMSGSAHQGFLLGAILSPLLLQSWTSFSQAWNGPSWSLSVEAFFYFLFPFVAFRLMRQSTGRALATTGSLWVASLLVVYAHITGHLDSSFFHSYVRYHPLFWAPCFVMGIGIARFASPWQRVPRAFASAVGVLTVTTIIFVCALCPPHYGEFIVTTGLVPLVALLIVCCSHESSAFVKLIGSRPLYRLGQVSYVIYIIQAPLWHYLAAATNKIARQSVTSEHVAAWQFVVFLPILLFTSYLISRYLETPIRTWMVQTWGQADGQVTYASEGTGKLAKVPG